MSTLPSRKAEPDRRPRAESAAPAKAPIATLVRFLAAGATTSLCYGLVFLLLSAATDISDWVLNLVATVVSTVLSSELHRRFTFKATRQVPVSVGQGVGGAMAVVGLIVNSLVLAAWNHLAPDAGDLSTLAVLYSATGLVGLANFTTLRGVVGSRTRTQPRNTHAPEPLPRPTCLWRSTTPRPAAGWPASDRDLGLAS